MTLGRLEVPEASKDRRIIDRRIVSAFRDLVSPK